MASITTRAGKGSALTFAEMDANFTNINNELANVVLGVLPADSVSSTELDSSGDFTVNSLTTTANVIVGDSIKPSSGNLEINTDYLQVSDASGTNTFKIRTDQSPGADQILKYNETTGFVQWATDGGGGGSSSQSQSDSDFQLNTNSNLDVNGNYIYDSNGGNSVQIFAKNTAESSTAKVIDFFHQDDGGIVLNANINVSGNKIVSTSNGDIDIEPNGTGNVLLGNMKFDADQGIGGTEDNYILRYDDTSGTIRLEDPGFVSTSGDENIAGTKTFTNGLKVPDDTKVYYGNDNDTEIRYRGSRSEYEHITYGNITVRASDSGVSSKGNVLIRADNKVELRAGTDRDSKGDLILTAFDDFQFRKTGYSSTDTDLTPTTNSSTSVVLGRALTTGEQNAFNDYSLYFFDGDPDSDNLQDMSRYREVDSDTAITGSGATTTITLYDPIENLSDTTHTAAKYLMFNTNSPAVVVDGTRGRLEDKVLNIQNRIGNEGPVGCSLKFESIEFHDGSEFLGTGTGQSDNQEESPVAYELKTFADQNQLKLEHSTKTAGSLTTTDVFSVRGRTTTSSTVSSKTAPEVVEFFLNPQVQSKTKAELDAITGRTGEIAMCSNGNAGSPCLAFYSGSAWLNASGAALSTS